MTELLLPLLIGVPADPAATADMAAVQVQSIWDFLVKGGPMMIPIAICSLAAFTVLVERLVSLRRGAIIPAAIVETVTETLRSDRTATAKAIEACHDDGSPVARVLAAGIRRLGRPLDQVEHHVQEAGERELLGLRKYLRLLSVVASVTPLMGLLGTIMGMITAFQTVATSGEALGRTELLAEGIYQAMISTAAGLSVAIPVLLAYHWLSAKIDRLVLEIDRVAIEFVDEFGDGASTTPPTPIATTETPARTTEPVARTEPLNEPATAQLAVGD